MTLLSSAGLFVTEVQEPFDVERERREPTWGDPSWRAIPAMARTGALGMTHLHVRNDDVLADNNVALPLDVLDVLISEGVVGAQTPTHVSVMGYQQHGLQVWREETAPQIVELLRSESSDGVVLAPV